MQDLAKMWNPLKSAWVTVPHDIYRERRTYQELDLKEVMLENHFGRQMCLYSWDSPENTSNVWLEMKGSGWN